METANLHRNTALRIWRTEVHKLAALRRESPNDLDEQRRTVETARAAYERAHQEYFETRAVPSARQRA